MANTKNMFFTHLGRIRTVLMLEVFKNCLGGSGLLTHLNNLKELYTYIKILINTLIYKMHKFRYQLLAFKITGLNLTFKPDL